MKHFDSHRRAFSTPMLPRLASERLGCCVQHIAGLFKAASGELRRLNALGLPPSGGGNYTRRERAAMARKALAERYRGHTRCC